MVNELFKELSKLEEVEAIALGGSRSGEVYDERSDYDVYLYITKPISESVRRDLLSRYCGRMEIGNHFWEYEDNCVLNNGIDIDILYRDLDDFAAEISSVVDKFEAHNCYTTCMWHNLKTCKILYDRDGRLAALKEKYDRPYPAQLKQNIIDRGMKLIRYGMPAFEGQILKAAERGDINSVNHRTAEFMAAYFDVIFALNEQTHPGEKRLIPLCLKTCKILPRDFAENIKAVFDRMFSAPDELRAALNTLITELEKILKY